MLPQDLFTACLDSQCNMAKYLGQTKYFYLQKIVFQQINNKIQLMVKNNGYIVVYLVKLNILNYDLFWCTSVLSFKRVVIVVQCLYFGTVRRKLN